MLSRLVIGLFLLVALLPVNRVQAGIITGVTTTSSIGTGPSVYYNLADLKNEEGLSSSSTSATHSDAYADMWLSKHLHVSGYLEFDLGNSYALADIAIWNWNHPREKLSVA